MTTLSSASRELRAAARHMNRRRFLTVSAAAAALAFTTHLPSAHAAAMNPKDIADDPFTLGVASGDPAPDSVALWTRLAPRPYEPDSGLPASPVIVDWQIAADENFTRIAASGRVVAQPEFHHSVHVEARGLRPGSDYWYRFRAGRWISPVGRTRTSPAGSDMPDRLLLGVVSCQNYAHGYFTALRHLAQEDLDVVFHLGDYIYEGPVTSVGGNRNYTDRVLPDVFNHETVTLDDYRLRYSLYKSDPDLIAAHAAHPWVVTWDDHEVENNYAGDVPQDGSSPEEFLIRRAAAYRAYYENMPLRRPQLSAGPDLRLYRRLRYGRLAQFDVLDSRQYRDDQAAGDGWKLPGEQSLDPSRTLLGATQERWLADGWRESRAVWNVVPQQVVVSRRHNRLEGPYPVSMDAWDGYPAARERFLGAADSAGIENLVVLTGDVHVHYGLDIKKDFDDPASRTTGVEIVTTSVASGGNGAERPANWETMMAANPHMAYYNGRRGYVRLTLDAQQLRADYRTVDAVTTPGAPVTTAASFVSQAGDPGLKPA